MEWTIPNELKQDPETVVPHYWNRRSGNYDDDHTAESYTPEELERWRTTLAELTDDPADTSALDVGTGTGFLALLLAELGHEVTGVDVAEEMLEVARQKASRSDRAIRFLHREAKHTGLEQNSFGLVISRLVLWNLPDPDEALREWIRVSRPGGTIAVIDGRDLGDVYGDEYRDVFGQLPFYGGMPSKAVESLFERHGVLDISTESMDGLLATEPWDTSDSGYYLVSGKAP